MNWSVKVSRFLEIGSLGWKHAGWQDGYYPEDMPEEWQLSFYAHSFRVVLVPYADWQADEPLIDEEDDDLGDEFHFFLLLPAAELASANSRLQSLRGDLGEHWGGVVLQPGSGDTVARLREMIAEIDGRVLIDARDLDDAGAEALLEAGLELSWRGGDNGHSPLAIIAEEQCRDLRSLGDLLKRFIGQMPEQGVSYLFFAGEPPQMARIQEAVTISEVMGVA